MSDLAILEREVLSLNRKDRGHLAGLLLKSLGETSETEHLYDDGHTAAWDLELQRRSMEMDEDPAASIPFDKVIDGLRNRFNNG